MLKFAFIMNIPGESPESYCSTYKNAESCSMVVGTDGMEQTEALIKKLIREGYTLFNLCGDFDDEMTAKLSAVAPGTKVKHANYSPKQLSLIESLESLSEYGVIVKMNGVEEAEMLTIKCKECNSYTYFVKDMDGAKKAAKALVEKGIYFIELCSWFDEDMTEEIINEIDNKVPVGSCGF